MAVVVAQTSGYTESGTAGTSHQLTSLTTTASNMLLVAIAAHDASYIVSGVTDSASNVYHRLISQSRSTVDCEIWATSAVSPTALSSGSITVTTSGSVGVAFRLYELSGARNTGFDNLVFSNGSSTSPSSGTTTASGRQTGMHIGAIAVGTTETFSSVTFTSGTGTDHTDNSTTTGSIAQLESSSRAQTNTTSQGYSATISPTNPWVAISVLIAAAAPFDEHEPAPSTWEFSTIDQNRLRFRDPSATIPETGQLWPRGFPQGTQNP